MLDKSILETVKKIAGIDGQDYFDIDIIIAINTVLQALTQVGVGNPNGFSISDETTTWIDFVGDDKSELLHPVITYVSYRVKMIFDPPQASAVSEAYKNIIAETEWRINLVVDSHNIEESEGGQNV